MRFLLILSIIVIIFLISPFKVDLAQDKQQVSPSTALVSPVVHAFSDPSITDVQSRLQSFEVRLEAINNKITSRISKLAKSGVKVEKLNVKIVVLNTSLNNIKKQMNTVSSSVNDYQKFKTEVLKLRGLFGDLLNSQKNIILEIKSISPVVTATPTAGLKQAK